MAEKSKRVIIFTTAYAPLIGGSELAIQNIIGRLPNVFFDVITARYSKSLNKFDYSNNFRIHRLGLGWTGDKYLLPLLGFFKAWRLWRRYDYGAIHAYQASYAAGAAWLFKLAKPNVKFILTLQEGKELNQQNMLIKYFRQLILKKADIITGISTYLVAHARFVNPKANLNVIPNGVDLQRFHSKNVKPRLVQKLRSDLGIRQANRVVITVSRLVSKNGIGHLIDAFSRVKSQLPEAKLLIVGTGPLESVLRTQTAKLGLADDVLFLGNISNEAIPPYLAMADVFVRPSLSEGLGNAFLEAMAMGLPVIGTPVGGIPDFIEDGQTGILSQVANADDLAQKILNVLANAKLRVVLAHNGRSLVAERFNWDNIAEKFKIIYSGI